MLTAGTMDMNNMNDKNKIGLLIIQIAFCLVALVILIKCLIFTVRACRERCVKKWQKQEEFHDEEWY
ncbi:hypothetical protein L596_019427 [Steinernema carpocapsae]|uniref:Uncharacterized protein n=1 Tax=Steinernema carpocapsae TaxID=34508 RepID=A0A4V6A0K0_STECR|nr:hypothetical protein L596_019427 [Steinernema carpocapsae]